MGINLEGSMDERLERASESRREGLRLPGWCAMVSSALCAHARRGQVEMLCLGRCENEGTHVEREDGDQGQKRGRE
jgi:hypothetical protein